MLSIAPTFLDQEFRHGESNGAIRLPKYSGCTALIALIVRAVLGLLMQES